MSYADAGDRSAAEHRLTMAAPTTSAAAPDPSCPELTVREFAQAERVTERTVRRWIAKGALAVRYTAGGGIRILERRQEHRVATT